MWSPHQLHASHSPWKPVSLSTSTAFHMHYSACVCVFQCQPTALLHVLGSTCKADRWQWVWSIFESCTAWADHITCGMSICIAYYRKLRLRWLYMCNCSCRVSMCCVGWWWKEGRRWNPVPAHSLLFSKSTKEAIRFNVPIRRTNCYQQYYMPSQRIYCGRVWNLIQACDVQSSN